ncbi:hypothetical protein GCM10010272_22350 [Streptomyces lateritius]|nr:hypothetical protein GCM10010272_22350 [Streptomyces lateritius]
MAIFGVGHVGLELARILARQDLDLHLIDSRSATLTEARLDVMADAVAQVHVHHTPLLVGAARQLIGSAAKWVRFRNRLATEGGHDEATIDRIKSPIGLADITGKEPATIAVGVAADLLRTFATEGE